MCFMCVYVFYLGRVKGERWIFSEVEINFYSHVRRLIRST